MDDPGSHCLPVGVVKGFDDAILSKDRSDAESDPDFE